MYANDHKRTITPELVDQIKKNRVTAAINESNDSPPYTSKTPPRSPLFDNRIPQNEQNDKQNQPLIDDASESRSFSLETDRPVRNKRNLVAVHNLTLEQLEQTLDLGGFPSPSIAIIKAGMGHSLYGDVSVLFNKQTIDPKANARNRVYGGDAWTPTFPSIEYKLSEKKLDAVEAKIRKLIPEEILRSSRMGYTIRHFLPIV